MQLFNTAELLKKMFQKSHMHSVFHPFRRSTYFLMQQEMRFKTRSRISTGQQARILKVHYESGKEGDTVNIQIFGTKKSQDTRKAERFFKERGIRYQFVDMKEKGLSRGEFESVKKAVGGLDNMIDQECKDKDLLALITWIAEEDRAQKVLENQSVLKLPIVRNGRQASIGYQPELWKTWS